MAVPPCTKHSGRNASTSRRGILLKGNGAGMLWDHVWPILLFMGSVLPLGLKTFRKTLD